MFNDFEKFVVKIYQNFIILRKNNQNSENAYFFKIYIIRFLMTFNNKQNILININFINECYFIVDQLR